MIVCISCWLIDRPVEALGVNLFASIPQIPELSTTQLNEIAKSITVKVFAGETSGSGILIHRQGRVYTVLTNEHVLTPGDGKQYRIQTPDGQIYPAALSRVGEFDSNDLGLLQFTSRGEIYAIASFNSSSQLCPGDAAFASGFPFGSPGFVFTTGQVSLILPQAFAGGYQIGYTNDIRKGMSGGPVLNSQGQLVGINGQHAYPLWGNPYVFEDGSVPNEVQYQQMIQLSWAVPVEIFVQHTKGLISKQITADCRRNQPTTEPVIFQPQLPPAPSPANWLW
ncbi:putative trypsin-like serine protease [Calothrix sp. NIES-2100]|nr:putative trypsin-like serine protease [Calothrix sp. NIES-2100]